MLQYPRPRQGPFLGHVTNQKDGRIALLGVADQQGGAFTHLGHPTRGGLQLLGKDGLDRIDHHDRRFFPLRGADDAFDTGLGHDPQTILGQAQTPRPHGHLLLRFLAGDVQGRHDLGQPAQGLQQDGRFADTRITTDQHHRTGHQPATEHPVQLRGATGLARHFNAGHLGQRLHLRLLATPVTAARTTATSWRGIDHGLDQGIPGLAFGTLASPLGKGGTAFAAAVQSFRFGHGRLESPC